MQENAITRPIATPRVDVADLRHVHAATHEAERGARTGHEPSAGDGNASMAGPRDLPRLGARARHRQQGGDARAVREVGRA